MSKEPQRITSLLGKGTFAREGIPKLVDACDQLAIAHTLLAVGAAEYNRGTNGRPRPLSRDGAIDVSPTQIRNSAGFVGDRSIAEAHRANWESPSHGMIDLVVELHQSADLADGQTLWLQSISSGHSKPGEESLRDYKTRLPHEFITTVTTIPAEAYLRDNLRIDPFLFARLKDADIVETTLVMDNLAPLALAFGLDHQDRFVTKGVATLLAAQTYFPNQRGFADVAHALGQYGAWAGVACASRNIVPSNEVGWWVPIRKTFGFGERARGDIDDIVIAAKEAAYDALTNSQTRAIDEPIDLHKPCFVAFTVPLKARDPRWQFFSRIIKHWLARDYPTVTAIFAPGQGTPDPRYAAQYWLQASVFHPLPNVPAPIQEILNRKEMTRRPINISQRKNKP